MSLQTRLTDLIAAIGADIKDIRSKIQPTVVTQEGWHFVGTAGEPAFQNSFVVNGNIAMRFRKTPAGVVEIQGDVTSTAADDTIVFTLPVGYRPDVVMLGGLLITNAVAGAYYTIGTDGTVKLHRISSSNQVFLRASFWVGQTTFPAGKSVIPVVAALPLGAADTDEIYFQTQAMAAAGTPPWHLRYRSLNPNGSANTSAYKWDVVGGAPLFVDEVVGYDAVNSAAYIDPITPMPNLTIPLAGEYLMDFGFKADQNPPVAGAYVVAIPTNSGLADAYAASGGSGAAGTSTERTTPTRQAKATYAAGATTRLMFKTAGGAWTIYQKFLRATPLRVG